MRTVGASQKTVKVTHMSVSEGDLQIQISDQNIVVDHDFRNYGFTGW